MPTSKKMVSLDMTLLAYLKTYLPGSYEVIDPALYEGKGFN